MTRFPLQLDDPAAPVDPLNGAAEAVEAVQSPGHLILSLLNNYSIIFIVAFTVTLLVVPVIRRIAIAKNIVDHPDQVRKKHAQPVAYLGGLAVMLGFLAAVGLSYFAWGGASPDSQPVPFSIILGVVVITLAGMADDIWKWDPRLKIAGQLVAAAALAIDDVGVRVAEGLLRPVIGSKEEILLLLGSLEITNGDVFYWAGTAIIAIFVLGGCNAANLLDGLDGLLSGTVAIVAAGLLVICLFMAAFPAINVEEGPTFATARIVLCFALLGAVLGFLPHNFNPAVIFLGDSGSLQLGFITVAIILMLGEFGQTHLVFAGLIVFALPIMDTVLAIIRRKLSGRSMSDADDQHIHHQLKRYMGGVKRAVFVLYGISFSFAVVGVSLAILVLTTGLRIRVVYAIAFVLFGFIGVIAFKAARRREFLAEAEELRAANGSHAPAVSVPRPRESRPPEASSVHAGE